MESIKNRIDFVYIFDVQDGNPNGDPDAGNLPRVDAETGQGLVSDVCLKRKIRNYVQFKKGEDNPEGYDILIREGKITNNVINDERKKNNMPTARKIMCEKYYDVRTFGAVMTTGDYKDTGGAGQVRGPVQMTFARSVSPIVVQDNCITRIVEVDGKKGRMGRKSTVHYGLYKCYGFINANFAKQSTDAEPAKQNEGTGFSEEDLELLWDALKNMFDCDRSAARGMMSARRLVAFRHNCILGNASASELFERVKITPVTEPVRKFEDYKIEIDKGNLPPGVTIEEIL